MTVTCDPASGSTFDLGETAVECSATDGAGNTGSASFNITIVDTTPPDLTLPADQLLEATGPGGAVATYTASASDLVDSAVSIHCSPASGSTFALGSTTVTCTATDNAGNLASGSFSVKVQDTTAPTLTVPADITEEATGHPAPPSPSRRPPSTSSTARSRPYATPPRGARSRSGPPRSPAPRRTTRATARATPLM